MIVHWIIHMGQHMIMHLPRRRMMPMRVALSMHLVMHLAIGTSHALGHALADASNTKQNAEKQLGLVHQPLLLQMAGSKSRLYSRLMIPSTAAFLMHAAWEPAASWSVPCTLLVVVK